MRRKKSLLIFSLIILGILSFFGKTDTYAKTRTITIDLTGNRYRVKRPKGLSSMRKVKVINSNKSIVKVSFVKEKNDRYIEFKGKKQGTSNVRVECISNVKKIYRYKVNVIKSKPKNERDYAKDAFKLQNKARRENDIPAITWSDELYDFCLYRLKTSGYDRHENLARDIHDYYGEYANYIDLILSENLYSGSMEPKRAIYRWLNSEGHLINMMSPAHKYGAIACMNGVWCAIFYDGDIEDINGFLDGNIKTITVKRYDEKQDKYVGESFIGYYEKGNKADTIRIGKIYSEEGKKIYVEKSRTYIIYESAAPAGLDTAERIEIKIDDDTPEVIILK